MSIIKNGNKIAGNYKVQLAPEATTEKSGAIRIATEDEAKAGILDNVAITPKQLGEVASSIDIPPATQETIGLVKPDGNSIQISEDGTLSADIPEVALATLTSAGLVQPDGTSITIANGIISAIAQGGDEWEYTLGTNTYFKHKKSGFTIQCGTATITTVDDYKTTRFITFPKAFNTSCCAVALTHSLSGSYAGCNLINKTKTNIEIMPTSIAITDIPMVWLAIGY